MGVQVALWRVLSLLSHAEFTTAVELVVEVVFAQEFASALLQTTLAPILLPKDGALDLRGGEESG